MLVARVLDVTIMVVDDRSAAVNRRHTLVLFIVACNFLSRQVCKKMFTLLGYPCDMSIPLRYLFVFVLVITNPISNKAIADVNFPCNPPHNSYNFCNISLSITERAHSLVSQLTLEEKIKQLANNASAIPRLGIPSYEWWSESLHGIAINGPGVLFNGTISSATSFPQVIVTTASFNRSLWFLIGSSIAIEARAMYNLGQAGLTFWAPNINIFRDPRWGRGQETPGEDPMVASAYAIEYVKGFQGSQKNIGFGGRRVLVEDGEGGDGLVLSACCKHLTAYDLEKWGNFSRYSFNAVVSEQDLGDTYQPPFRSCVEQGKASCLMCSYNQVNGVPTCAHKDFLQKARTEWGFKGYIAADCGAVSVITEYQNFTKTPEDSVAVVLKAGVDIDCGSTMLNYAESAIKKEKVAESDVDRALINLFSVQLRLGVFNGDPRKGRLGSLGPADVCTTGHKMLSLEAARQGIVLLKNDDKLLPLNKSFVSSLAIIGPMANNSSKMGGGYSGYPCEPKSLYEGLKAYIEKTSYAAGCPDVACDSNVGFNEAISIAKESDFVMVVAGLDLTQETEDLDRTTLLLPGNQMALVSTIASVSSKPVILVLTGGGPLDVSFAEKNPNISSIIWIGYPGEGGAKALAEIIFGDCNPSGRLPLTWYLESFTKVPMNDMNMRADPSRGYPGRTYRFFTGDRLYGFGHGLSYTNFTYNFLSAPKRLTLLNKKTMLHQRKEVEFVYTDEVNSCDSLRFLVQVSVTNIGDRDGSHAVLLFARMPQVVAGTPERQLIGFDRVDTSSFESSLTSIVVDPCHHLSIGYVDGKMIIPLGSHVLLLGDSEHPVSIEV